MRQKRNDSEMVRQMWSVRLEAMISTAKLKQILLQESFQIRRLQWFGRLKKWKRVPCLENNKTSKLVLVQLEDNLEKHRMKLKRDLEEWTFMKELFKDENMEKSFMKTYFRHFCMEKKI